MYAGKYTSRRGGAVITQVKGRVLLTLPGLRDARTTRGWSQRELAQRSGVSPVNVVRIENGQRTTLQSLGKLAIALDVELDALTTKAPELTVDEEGIEDQYVQRFTMGGEVHDPEFEAALVDKKLLEFREAVSTDEAFRGIATELLLLGKARGRELA